MTETPDAHMVETLRLRTAALHRVIGSNDLLRRENDDLRARMAALADKADGLANASFNHEVQAFTFGIANDIRAILDAK